MAQDGLTSDMIADSDFVRFMRALSQHETRNYSHLNGHLNANKDTGCFGWAQLNPKYAANFAKQAGLTGTPQQLLNLLKTDEKAYNKTAFDHAWKIWEKAKNLNQDPRQAVCLTWLGHGRHDSNGTTADSYLAHVKKLERMYADTPIDELRFGDGSGGQALAYAATEKPLPAVAAIEARLAYSGHPSRRRGHHRIAMSAKHNHDHNQKHKKMLMAKKDESKWRHPGVHPGV